MITAMLQGGLGNQMLQYAFGLATAKRLNTELVLDIDLLKNDRIRQYNLSLFSGVTERIVTGSRATVNEDGLPYNQAIVDSIKDGDVLRGYWPTEKYFEGIRQDLAARFQPKQPLPQLFTPTAEKWIRDAGERSTFLTVRRTDYVQKQDFHGVLPIDYYNRALREVAVHLFADPEVFVFSDEPDWCKQNLNLDARWRVLGTYDQTTPTHLGREDVDLYLMSLCINAITANSSFSWWGAWLGEQRRRVGGSIITAPKQWFTTTEVDSRDIVPERWITL